MWHYLQTKWHHMQEGLFFVYRLYQYLIAEGIETRKGINGPNIAFWYEWPNSCEFTESQLVVSRTNIKPISNPTPIFSYLKVIDTSIFFRFFTYN